MNTSLQFVKTMAKLESNVVKQNNLEKRENMLGLPGYKWAMKENKKVTMVKKVMMVNNHWVNTKDLKVNTKA